MKLIQTIKSSKLYKEKLADTEFIAVLKKGKRGLSKTKARLVGLFKQHERYPRLVPILEELFYRAQEKPAYTDYPFDREEPVDVIVPIYNGYEYLRKLFSGLLQAGMPCHIILVDDKSPDERVQVLLQEFADSHENVTLLTNENNLGFVKTVNKALAIAKGHVALINTDTELPRDWCKRLMYPIFTNEKVGTVTPYTNSGTIFSFPNFCYNNPIYRGLGVQDVDAVFERVKPHYAKAPTGVGFCMGMSRAAIDAVGFLDEEKYGRGYGEENDWCQRAIQKGFCNVHAENLFVWHKHGGSFLSEEKKKLIEAHSAVLSADYPHYNSDVEQYIRRDENRNIRQIAEMMLDTTHLKSVLFVNHCLGGGATKYLEERKKEIIADGGCVSIIAFDTKIPVWTFTFENYRGVQQYECFSMEEVETVCSYLRFDELYVNELVSFAHIWDMMEVICRIADKQECCKKVFLCHDYFAICPGPNLTNDDFCYCGMPDADNEACMACYRRRNYPLGYACDTRALWLERWKRFLVRFDEVRAFSQDTKTKFETAFGEGTLALTVVPHKVEYLFPMPQRAKTTDRIHIGLMGVLTMHKGGGYIKKLCEEAARRDLPVDFVLIGKTAELDMKGVERFRETGTYHPSELPMLIAENDIDLFFVSSVCPETFSYTAEEAMKLGMPIAAFPLGAPMERVQAYQKGCVLSGIMPQSGLDELLAFASRLGIEPKRATQGKILYLAEYISFSSRYRLEHLREELLYQGITGELMEIEKFPEDYDLTGVRAVVIYRSRLQGKLPEVIEKVREHNIPLIYDIDDFIFRYDAIKDLPFFGTEEYKDFGNYSESINRCMQQMDRFLVSTEHMKQAILEHFPGKPVYVNRNVASAQMLIRSAMTKHKPDCNLGHFVLGYYSGSNTHNRDFELIAPTLADFLKKHSDVYLKIVGCLEPGELFETVADRILREGFMDWRELPHSISEVDVNLMPLEDTFFHRCKSENKWMEAGLVEVCTVASDNPEIAAVTKDRENIYLCRQPQDWEKVLEFLYENREAAESTARNANLEVTRNKTTLVPDKELVEFIMGD